MEASVTLDFKVPAAEVWAIVGNFYGLADWFPGVETCDRDPAFAGEVRQAVLSDGRKTPERLQAFDEAGMTLGWSIVGAERFIGAHRSTLTLSPLSASACRADWVFRFEPQDGFDPAPVAASVEDLYGKALAAVRDTVEKKSS